MANQALIQGAAAIAQAKGTGKLAAAKAWTKIGEDLSEKLSPVVQDRYDEWQKYSKLKLSKQGLDDDEWDSLYQELEQKRGQYIFGNSRARAEMLRDVDFLASQVTDKEGFLGDLADAADEENDESGLSEQFKNSALGTQFLDMLNGNNKAVVGEDGKTLGYMIDSGIYAGDEANGEEKWYSLDDLRGVIGDFQYDKNTSFILEQMVDGLGVEINDYFKANGEVPPPSHFNYWLRYNSIKNGIVEEGQLRSMAKDQHIGGKAGRLNNGEINTFENSLIEALVNETYGQFGIESDQFEDPTSETKITKPDAQKIAQGLMQNESMLKDYLARYYTNHMYQNWSNAAGYRDDDTSNEELNMEDQQYLETAVVGGKWGTVEGKVDISYISNQMDEEEGFLTETPGKVATWSKSPPQIEGKEGNRLPYNMWRKHRDWFKAWEQEGGSKEDYKKYMKKYKLAKQGSFAMGVTDPNIGSSYKWEGMYYPTYKDYTKGTNRVG